MNKIIAILALVGALLGVHYWSQGVAVRDAVKIATADLNKEWQAKVDEAQAKSDKADEELKKTHYEELQTKNQAFLAINGKLNARIVSLQNRPTRTEYITLHPEAGAACTGRELPREDAGFLEGEAASAQKRVIERDYYYNEYEALRLNIEQLRK